MYKNACILEIECQGIRFKEKSMGCKILPY